MTIVNLSAAVGRTMIGFVADRVGPVNALFFVIMMSGLSQLLVWTFVSTYGGIVSLLFSVTFHNYLHRIITLMQCTVHHWSIPTFLMIPTTIHALIYLCLHSLFHRLHSQFCMVSFAALPFHSLRLSLPVCTGREDWQVCQACCYYSMFQVGWSDPSKSLPILTNDSS